MSDQGPFPQDALAQNRAERLTPVQRQAWRSSARGFRKAELQFAALLTTSVAVCAAEAATYPDSAYSRLSGVSLKGIASGDYGTLNSWLTGLPTDRVATWTAIVRVYDGYHLIVPAGGALDGLWVVDPITGVAKAVLSNEID